MTQGRNSVCCVSSTVVSTPAEMTRSYAGSHVKKPEFGMSAANVFPKVLKKSPTRMYSRNTDVTQGRIVCAFLSRHKQQTSVAHGFHICKCSFVLNCFGSTLLTQSLHAPMMQLVCVFCRIGPQYLFINDHDVRILCLPLYLPMQRFFVVVPR